jgi:hypothetical protein
MKKVLTAGVVVAAMILAGLFAFRGMSAQQPALESSAPSKQAAQSLQKKIDDIKKADAAARPHPPVDVQVSETELESYVLFELRESIPAQLDALDVQLTPGSVAADTQLTFNSNATGNPIFDALVGGTHNLFVKGQLSGNEGLGRFELEEVRVDGIPVPKVLIYTLVDKYVKPKYPDVDMKAPFELPWSIRSLEIQSGKAKIGY